MIHLQGTERLFIAEDLMGFADEIDQQGIMARRVDLLFLGFSFAVNNGLQPAPAQEFQRRQLIAALQIDPEVMFSIEAVAQWYTKEQGLVMPEDESELLALICSLGISGIRALQERWQNKSKSQIQLDILQLT